MRDCYGYIRVSTGKQTKGVSLEEQRDAILRYAARTGIQISQWFIEVKTAAKHGRPEFTRMVALLRKRQAEGVIVHKIDRGARNLEDWNEICKLSDEGIEVHFANDGLDLNSRGGRLSADIQAVVAADYIRNVREEATKGFEGRLKQGFYPLPAPIGYLDQGKAKAKTPDPQRAHFISKGFELYDTMDHSLESLAEEMFRRGLRTRRGKRVGKNGWALILRNSFYIGLIHIRTTGQTFAGLHQPLVNKSRFDRVQGIMTGKINRKAQKRVFLLSRLCQCGDCGKSLIAERQKGHVYYRCQTKHCPTKGIREELIDEAIRRLLASVRFGEAEMPMLREKTLALKQDWSDERERTLQSLRLQEQQVDDRLTRLTDALVDGLLEKPAYEQRNTQLLMEKKRLGEARQVIESDKTPIPNRLEEFLELANNAWLSYELGNVEEKREMVKVATSNRTLTGKNVCVEPSLLFSLLEKCPDVPSCGPSRDRPRTLEALLPRLLEWFKEHPETTLPSFSTHRKNDTPIPMPKKRGNFAVNGRISSEERLNIEPLDLDGDQMHYSE